MHEKTNLELQIICESKGLSNKGGKLDLIARLKKAGITDIEAIKPEERREKRRGRPRKQ